VRQGSGNSAPGPLFTCSKTGALEFLLPPGRFELMPYGSDVNWVERPVEIKPDDRELFLGTIEVPPSEAALRGEFPNHGHSAQHAKPNADTKNKVVTRRSLGLVLKGQTIGSHDLAFSPDGKILATAHGYNADPGEVKLWDTSTGVNLATLPVPREGVSALAFSPDGKFLAGSVCPLGSPQPAGIIVVWDVGSRREVWTLRGHAKRIATVVFSPDGKTLASGGEDKTVRFWDLSSGRETGRIEGNHGWVRSVSYAPDGKTLAIGTGLTLKLWDVPGNHLRAVLEPEAERFWVLSVAHSPDGRTLAAAGAVVDQRDRVQAGQVRLYDVAQDRPARRPELVSDRQEPDAALPQNLFSSVTFTPDGRRVVAVAMQKIRIWDVATGTEQDAFERGSSSTLDRLAISPDGRWLAITGPGQVSILDISPAAP
jgi:WD40 repeat protein